ncbi:MAG TPA: glycosyltransferase [Candidatus Angelobacter sp.]|nr:glycosyltransferase [Candidatus Angelobacter sp.]
MNDQDYGLTEESIVCFAGEDWWYHHPHSKNHILKRLAKRNKVLFINSLSMGLPAMSNPDFFLKIRRKLRSYMRWLRRAPEGLWVMTPINLPVYGPRWAQTLNRWLLAVQIHWAMRLCGISRPILWVAIPSAAVVAESLDAKLVLYQVSDKYDANEDSALDVNVIRGFDRQLRGMADLVVYSGRKLFEESSDPRKYFLQQAVDYQHFADEAAATAPEIAAILRPVLGYFGAMDFVMDAKLIEEVARLRPEWHWVLVGLRSNLTVIDAPNVHFTGPKPYEKLPEYIRHFDVCVLPWKLSSTFTSYGSAIKVREYLATGKPVVMAPLYEYKDAPVRFYETTEEFIAAVEDALQFDSAADRERRQAFVRDGTWDTRTRQLADLLMAIMAKKHSASSERRESVASV